MYNNYNGTAVGQPGHWEHGLSVPLRSRPLMLCRRFVPHILFLFLTPTVSKLENPSLTFCFSFYARRDLPITLHSFIFDNMAEGSGGAGGVVLPMTMSGDGFVEA
jgi:hypothetical protein